MPKYYYGMPENNTTPKENKCCHTTITATGKTTMTDNNKHKYKGISDSENMTMPQEKIGINEITNIKISTTQSCRNK